MTNNEPSRDQRGFMQRAAGRIRHGLVVQEILDRLARAGLLICPYFITVEAVQPGAAAPADERLALRWLGPDDAPAMAEILDRPTAAQAFQTLAPDARCMGAFWNGRLAGFSWLTYDLVPMPGPERRELFRLASDEVYLFGMFIAREYRGLRLAGALRSRVYDELAMEGRTRLYSVTLAFNRSSRRFKARLGAREVELRLYLHPKVSSLSGLDMRIWRAAGERLRTQGARRIESLKDR